MLSSNTQSPARRARIVKRPQGGQIFIRPGSTQAHPQTTGRDSRVDSAVSDLLNQLSQVNLGDGTEVQIASVDYDNIVNELSSRLANTNFQVVAADGEGYASGKSPPPPSRRRTKRGGADDDLLKGLARSEARRYREARVSDGQRNHANVIRLDPMAIPEYFWDTLEIKDRLEIQAMGGSASTCVERMKAMLLQAQRFAGGGQEGAWLVETDVEM